MAYYPVIDLAGNSPRDPEVGREFEPPTLEAGDQVVMPVFISLDRFRDFVDRCYAGEDSVQPSALPMDPFRLAQMIGPLGRAGKPDHLVFDPLGVSEGRWKSAVKPIAVAHYCRFISEVRPAIGGLVRESEAKFGVSAPPGSEAFEEILGWSTPKIERLADSAGARVEEWWKRHGVYRRTRYARARSPSGLDDGAATEATEAPAPLTSPAALVAYAALATVPGVDAGGEGRS